MPIVSHSTDERLPCYLTEGDPPSKRAVLGAALRLFVARGLYETTVREIADAAGFSNPVLFKYFRSRDALAVFLFERCYASFASDVVDAARPGPPFAVRLESVVATACRVLDTDLDAFLFVNENLRRLWPQIDPKVRRFSVPNALDRLFRDAHEAGGDATPDPTILTTAFVGTLGQLARLHYFGEIGPRASDHAEGLTRLFLNMVGAPSKSPTRRRTTGVSK